MDDDPRRAADASDDEPQLRVSAATFAWMADHARDLREAETARADNLDTKAATLAGFSGVILSISASVAASDGPHDTTSVTWLLCISLLFLVGAATAALIGVLLPQPAARLSPDELLNYTIPPFATASAPDVQSRTITTSAKVIRRNQRANQRKARCLQLAVALLAAGLLSVASLAVTLQLSAKTTGHTEEARGPYSRGADRQTAIAPAAPVIITTR